MKILVHIGFLYLLKLLKLFILIVLVSNIFLKKLINLLVTVLLYILKVIYLEYQRTIQFCVYFCIEFIDYILKGKTLLDYTNLFPPMNLKRTIELLREYLKNE